MIEILKQPLHACGFLNVQDIRFVIEILKQRVQIAAQQPPKDIRFVIEILKQRPSRRAPSDKEDIRFVIEILICLCWMRKPAILNNPCRFILNRKLSYKYSIGCCPVSRFVKPRKLCSKRRPLMHR